MRVELLGPMRVFDDSGNEIAVPAGRRRALLTRLALEPGRIVSAFALIDSLWESAPPANAPGALQTHVSRLRRLVGDHLHTASGGYRLVNVETDVAEFEQHAAEAETSRDRSSHAVRDAAGRALRLWRGPALGDVADFAFADTAIARLTARRETVASLHAEARLELEGAAPVLAELAARNSADPLSEGDAARYMRALASLGRQAEALGVFEKVRTHLAEELGVDPSPALTSAHLDVLRGTGARSPAPAGHLPEPLTSCVGRERELAELEALIGAGRLVTVTGPGGAGKTRLAMEIGRRVERGGGAVRLVELAPVRDPGRLPDVFLDALGGESALSRATGDALERLLEVLRNRDLLLIADNCEHLIDAAAVLLTGLLSKAPRLRILATSRESLGVAGERVYGVPPLAAAAALFEERARQSDAAFDAPDPALVERVCAALDRLPLAIELAAARMRSMTLRELASRLDDRFSLLNRGDRTAAPRQRSLRGVVDWSWDLLEPRERRLLARLSVFVGGADLTAITEVCAAPVDLVSGLVDKSLLQRLPSGRYRLLETVREYAAERLAESGETAAVHAAHAAYFTRLAETAEPHLTRTEQVEWLERIAADHDNLTAAIRRLVAGGDTAGAHRIYAPTTWYWWMRGHRKEGREFAEQIRAMPGEVDPLHRAKVAMGGTWSLWSGDLDPAELEARWTRVQELVDRHRLRDRDPVFGLVPVLRAVLAGEQDALRGYLETLDAEDAWVRAMTLFFAAGFSAADGDADRAAAEIAEAGAAFTAIGERFGMIMSLQGLAADRESRGDYAGARELVLKALRSEAEFGAGTSDSVIIDHLWRLDAEHGDDPEGTLAVLRRAAANAERAGSVENAMSARMSAAICLRRLGRLEQARDELLAAEADRPRFIAYSEVTRRVYRTLREVARELGDRGLERRAAERVEEVDGVWPFSP